MQQSDLKTIPMNELLDKVEVAIPERCFSGSLRELLIGYAEPDVDITADEAERAISNCLKRGDFPEEAEPLLEQIVVELRADIEPSFEFESTARSPEYEEERHAGRTD